MKGKTQQLRHSISIALQDLASDDLEVRMLAVEHTIEAINQLTQAVIHSLVDAPDPYLVAERLSGLGSIAIPYLEQVLRSEPDAEVQILASLVLHQLGSPAGIPRLVEALHESTGYTALIARSLAETGNPAFAEDIIARLHQSDLSEIAHIEALLDALEVLETPCPVELHDRFSQPAVAWGIRARIEKCSSEQ